MIINIIYNINYIISKKHLIIFKIKKIIKIVVDACSF